MARLMACSGAAGCSKKGNKDEIQALLKAKKDAAEAAELKEQQKAQQQQENPAAAAAAANLIESGYDITKWTGKTPATLLQELCQRSGWARPDYRILPHVLTPQSPRRGGHVASVAVTRPETPALPAKTTRFFDPTRVYATELEARHFAAVMALHGLSYDKPLHRLLPPGYRDYWATLEGERATRPNAAAPCEPFASPPPKQRVRKPKRVFEEALPIVNMSESLRQIVEDAIHAVRNYSNPLDRPQGFMRAHVEEGLRYAADTASLMDWLLLHVPEADLPAALRPQSLDITAAQHTPETLARHYQAQRIAAAGFDLKAAVAALQLCGDHPNSALKYLLESLVREGDDAPDVAACMTWDAPADTAVLEEELEALQSIYENSLTVERTAEAVAVAVAVAVDGVPATTTLRVIVPRACAYPAAAPLLAIENAALPAFMRLVLLGRLYRFAKDSAGDQVMFALVGWLQDNMAACLAAPPPLAALKQFEPSAAPSAAASEESAAAAPSQGGPTAGRRSHPRRQENVQAEQARLQRQVKSLGDNPITAVRAKLPVASFRSQIVEAIRSHRVVVVCGETGCGKTTQVPQFVLEDFIARGMGGQCSIVCTQPRRLSAIAVAERVASERGEGVGRTSGYAVRLAAKRSQETRLLFCTTGLLLRRLQDDPLLSDCTHVFVDEVHERSVDGDYLLALLRDMVRQRQDLKVVLMSATLDSRKFSAYFQGAPVVEVPGFTHPVKEYFLEDILAFPEIGLAPSAIKHIRRTAGLPDTAPGEDDMEELDLEDRLTLEDDAPQPGEESASGSDSSSEEESDEDKPAGPKAAAASAPAATATATGADKVQFAGINYDLVCAAIGHLSRQAEPGAILVFMPGVGEISRTVRQLQSFCERSKGIPPLTILPLHATLTPAEQSKVFQRAPEGRRKVIVATNVAETSITIDDVVAVVDSGRVKETQYDAGNHMACLVEGWTSQASTRQRQGRAGRTRPGVCYKLFSRGQYATLSPHQVPEILRIPLEQVVLSIKALTEKKVGEFLAAMMDSPHTTSVAVAVQALRGMGVLDPDDALTPLGRHVARIPADVRVGKMLVFGALLGCLDPVATVAASSGLRSPFLSPAAAREDARRRHARFSADRSDLLSYAKAFNEWLGVRSGGMRAEKAWCEENFVSGQVMSEMRELREQYINIVLELGLAADERAANARSADPAVVKAAICAGLYPQAARVVLPQSTYVKMTHGTVALPAHVSKIKLYLQSGPRAFIHPGSLLFHEAKFENMTAVFNEKMSTSKIFLRDVTLVGAYPLLLFGGALAVDHLKQTITVDGWLRFRAPARIAVLANELRKGLDALLLQKIADPECDVSSSPILHAMLALLGSEAP